MDLTLGHGEERSREQVSALLLPGTQKGNLVQLGGTLVWIVDVWVFV